MVQIGGEIERRPDRLPAASSTGPLPVEVVQVDSGGQSVGELAREARTQRAEIANRVLTLLTSLGNLALRIIELRQSSASSVQASPPSLTTVARTSQQVVGARPGGGRGERRRRHRGGSGGR